MTEQDLHDYNKWLTEVWSKQHSNIPFMIDAPKAYLIALRNYHYSK